MVYWLVRCIVWFWLLVLIDRLGGVLKFKGRLFVKG